MQLFPYSRILGVVLAFALLFTAGCKKKKPAVPPPQAQAPTITTQQPEQKPEQTQPTQPATQPQEQPPAQQPQEQPQAPEKPSPSKPKHTSRRHPSTSTSNTTAKKPATPPPAPTTAAPPNTTASAKPPATGPDADVGQISPAMSRSAVSQDQQTTTQLLDTTEQNLHALTRTLSTDEQHILSDIRSYIVQARSALKDQDFERAHNLALKAHQLSDVLLKQ